VATISRMLKNIGLFCKRDLQKRPIFCKETYIFKHPTHRSHPISRSSWRVMCHLPFRGQWYIISLFVESDVSSPSSWRVMFYPPISLFCGEWRAMGWLRLVGCLKIEGSSAKETYKRDLYCAISLFVESGISSPCSWTMICHLPLRGEWWIISLFVESDVLSRHLSLLWRVMCYLALCGEWCIISLFVESDVSSPCSWRVMCYLAISLFVECDVLSPSSWRVIIDLPLRGELCLISLFPSLWRVMCYRVATISRLLQILGLVC